MRIQAVAAAIAPVFLLSLAYGLLQSCGDRSPNESARVRYGERICVPWTRRTIYGELVVGGHGLARAESYMVSITDVPSAVGASINGMPVGENPATRADDLLWRAICQVESGGDPNAYNEREGAAGIAQIRPVYLADANRIVGYERFVLADRYDPAKSKEMFEIVTGHYSRGDSHEEEAARIHVGGPTGMSKAASLPYWCKVQAAVAQLEGEWGARRND